MFGMARSNTAATCSTSWARALRLSSANPATSAVRATARKNDLEVMKGPVWELASPPSHQDHRPASIERRFRPEPSYREREGRAKSRDVAGREDWRQEAESNRRT